MIPSFKKNKNIKPESITDLATIKKELKHKSGALKETSKSNKNLTAVERKLIQSIYDQTESLNRNNVTRTQAYLDFYLQYPEVEWAFLGHMVSRNGGWNMTDLKGEFLSKLLSEKEQQEFFQFLERGNWLIFQDVYPQFLLYRESLRQNTPLFHLLPYFGVSTFIETIWSHFLVNQNRYLLAISMVINEQSYLEKRVIQNNDFKKSVLETFEFKLQDLLSLNHILFPTEEQITKLVGLTLHHFSSLHERILLGKRLYFLLFNDKDSLRRFVDWATTHTHTGSRKDYWPHLFNDVRERLPGLLYEPKIKNCTLKKHSARLYSPRLEFAWKDINHESTTVDDWFQDWRVIEYLENPITNVNGEIMNAYCKTLETLEFFVYTKKAIFHRKE